MSIADVIYLVILVFCVILSAFFASSETAFIALPSYRLEHLVAKKVPGAKRVARLMAKPERFLSTVLLGNNLVNTAAAALATVLTTKYLGEARGTIVATIAMTIILLVFAESTPKTMANVHAEQFSLRFSRAVAVTYWLFSPFVSALSWIASSFTRMAGGKPVPRSIISDEEIRTMISVGHKAGTVEADEAKLLDNVFKFGDRPASEVMVPRTEVVWVEKGMTFGEFLELYTRHPFSRFPVFEESLDNVVGIITIKDVLMGLARNTVDRNRPVDAILRPAYFTPETKPISDLFAEMQSGNYHIAIIVDEYGGTAGIVTLEQLHEEIVGPVGDELAGNQRDFQVVNAYTFRVDGSMRIEEANQEMGLDLPDKGGFETIAGLMMHSLGHIPKTGEGVKYKNLKLVVTKMVKRKIEEILITKEIMERESQGDGKAAP